VWRDNGQNSRKPAHHLSRFGSSKLSCDPVAKGLLLASFYACQHDSISTTRAASTSLKGDILSFWLDLGVGRVFARCGVHIWSSAPAQTARNLHEDATGLLKLIRGGVRAPSPGFALLLAESEPVAGNARSDISQRREMPLASTFPLFAAIIMALAQEDREPIVDIIERTSDLPRGMPMGIVRFRRNHDE